jgi:hypothetical protein
MLFFVWPDHKFLRSKKYISDDSYQLAVVKLHPGLAAFSPQRYGIGAFFLLRHR